MIATAAFRAFFEAAHGYPPFRWQARLANLVFARGWGEARTVAAPTGTGKTAVLDIALFHLAIELARGGPRTAPIRIVYAVDRRVIVDQAFERAMRLRDMLTKATAGILAEVSAALGAAGGESPLHVEQLRGGLPREDDWTRSPVQPTILCTTIDQLGSRLLFRGYGVSRGMAPVHAGLLGEDALLILDEAHLSQAFEDTLGGVARLRRSRELGRPWAVTSLTATPRGTGAVFALDEEDKGEAVISTRLRAAKPAALVAYKGKSGEPGHVAEFVRLARAAAGPGRTVAVVVNRVALARAVRDELDGAESGAAILLTGRSRPAERDRLVEDHRHRVLAGRTAVPDAPPLFVVATQCVEAGADFDFDALITQLAPLDALRQRFGRLARRGGTAPGWIVAAGDETSNKADDPIYGDRAKATWDWLRKQGNGGPIDFGPAALDARAPPSDLGSPGIPAPLLREADIDFFAMTSPVPHPDPHLPLFLRGAVEIETDVQLVWRADLGEAVDRWAAIVAAMPPRPGEALAVPAWAARSWLRQKGAAAEFGDVTARGKDDDVAGNGRAALRWRGREQSATGIVYAGDVCPGDTLVVPSSYGGCDRFGWAPDSAAPVAYIADLALAPYAKRAAALRIHAAHWTSESGIPTWTNGSGSSLLADDDRSAPSLLARLQDSLAQGEALPAAWREAIARLASLQGAGARLELLAPYDDAEAAGPTTGLVLTARLAQGRSITDGDDAGSFLARAVTLADHRRDVEAKARLFAERAGLPARLADTLALAGRLHDDGKADPRFQAFLGAAPDDTPLAKSAGRIAQVARDGSDKPHGWRHEALSVRLAAATLDQNRTDIDADLVLWLVGTHHGLGRPFFGAHTDPWDRYSREVGGVVLPPSPGPERLDFDWNGMDWAGLFAELRGRYGTWGLAWLEATLRLADHRASEDAEAGR